MNRPDRQGGASRLRATWQRLDGRERRLINLAAAVVGLALLWWVGLAPALRTLNEATSQRTSLQAQAQQMQRLKLEADALKAMPRMSQEEAIRALEAATKQRLGNAAQLSVVGDRANIVLKAAPAAELSNWLTDARVNARSTPVEARLSRSGGAAAGDGVSWNGTLSLSLPGP